MECKLIYKTMIERESQIKELFDLKHRKDEDPNIHFDYENRLMEKLMPEYGRRNDNVFNFTNQIQKLMVWGIETQLVLRNYYNPSVSKYYSNHPN